MRLLGRGVSGDMCERISWRARLCSVSEGHGQVHRPHDASTWRQTKSTGRRLSNRCDMDDQQPKGIEGRRPSMQVNTFNLAGNYSFRSSSQNQVGARSSARAD